jgi:hypothetical protein
MVLRAGASVGVQLGKSVHLLTTRALLIHKAEESGLGKTEVGWGRFELNPENLITCPDDEPTIIYQGPLNIGTHLRAPIPLPKGITGDVTLTATVLISPQVDASFLGSYTESGFTVVFRPNDKRFTKYPNGDLSKHPTSASFFSEGAVYGESEFELREGGLKWEPCVKRSRKFRSTTLSNPCFDIFYNRREEGAATARMPQMQYALIVTILAPKVPDLYDKVVRMYANILVPIQPQLRIRLTT